MKWTIVSERGHPVVFVLLMALACPAAILELGARQSAGAAGASPSSVKLKPEVESLASFEGKWSCKGVFPSSGKSIESQIVFAPDLEGAWLSVRHDDLPPNRFHAAEYWGFDPAEKQFVAFIYDNFGGVRKFVSAGWADEKLIWLREASKADPPVVQRFVYKRDSPAQFQLNWEVKKGPADWAIGDTLTCKK